MLAGAAALVAVMSSGIAARADPKPDAGAAAPLAVARRVPAPPPGAQPRRLGGILVGERWGCGGFPAGNGTAWQCWDAGPNPRAFGVPWMTGHLLQAAPDRLCEFERPALKFRCWQRPRRGDTVARELPESWEWLNPNNAPWDSAYSRGDRVGDVFIGGTFACLQTTKGHGLFCRGDDRFGQLGGSGTPGPDAEREDPAFVPHIWPAHFPAGGTWHACALAAGDRDGLRVMCWGRGDHGQLGAPATAMCAVDKTAVPCARTPVSGLKSDEMAVLGAGDLFTCLTTRKGIECWGASRDAIFGARGSCPESLKRAWPTLGGPVPAPNAACSDKPVAIAGINEFEPHFRVAPRGLCFNDKGQLRCLGAIPLSRDKRVAHLIMSPGSDASACAIRAGNEIVCWGEGYSPPGAPDQPVAIAFDTPPPIGETAVIQSGDAASWSSHCLIQMGCTRSLAPMPACAAGAKATAWTELLATAASRKNQVVRVRGPLGIGRSSSTLVGCNEHTCCNTVYAEAVIGGASSSLVLAGQGCAGDESLQCCNVPAYGQTVVAEGRLQADAHGSATSWTLAQPKLCVEGAASRAP